MPHPRTLAPAQREHLAALCHRHGVSRVASELGINRDVTTRLAAGFTCHAGTVALALLGLPRLDAALVDAPIVGTHLRRVPASNGNSAEPPPAAA